MLTVKEKIDNRTIKTSVSLLDAMKQMDNTHVKTLFVFNDDHFEGILTLGDIQRAIIKSVELNTPIGSILDNNKVYGLESEEKDTIMEKMRRMRAEVMPIINEGGELVDVWFWNDLFESIDLSSREKIDLPVVPLTELVQHLLLE